MGPKKKGQEMSSKTEKKMKEKVIEDKTFGLKNKNKSKVVQNYVKGVQTQVMHGQEKGGARAIEEKKFAQKKEKKNKEQEDALLASLFKNAQKLAGNKLAETYKENQQIDFYKDPRQGTEFMPVETIITCKHFLDAVEDELYGWRWECPNKGKECQYRHMLPEGYKVTTKKEREKMKADGLKRDEDTTTLEEKIEEERAALPSEGLTPVTAESFKAWKEKRAAKKQAELEEQMIKAEAAKSSKKGLGKDKNKGIMSGRALFTFNPEMFKDDDAAMDDKAYEEEKVGDPKDKIQGKDTTVVDEALFADEADADEDVDFD